MTRDVEAQRMVLAIKVDDPVLAHRLELLLADVPGLRLAHGNEVPDVAVIATNGAERSGERDAVLTAREIQVLRLLAEGASNKSIARQLGISIHTVKFHVASLLDKFEAIGRTDAVTHAVRLGLIQL